MATDLSTAQHLDVVTAMRSGEFARLRRSAGMRQEDVARNLAVHVQTVIRWEKGVIVPDAHNLGGVHELLTRLRVVPAAGAGR